ncbi:hypothetical protein ACX0G9_25860 [Flavitalea flava]
MKYIYYFLLVSGLVILILRRKRIDRRLLLFGPLYFFNIVTELITDLTDTYFYYHINQAIGCFLLFLYYFLLFRENRYRKWIWVAFGLYLSFFTIYFIRYPAYFFNFDPIDFVVEGVFITLFSLYYLVDLYRSEEQLRFFQYPHFWVASGNLLFYSGASLFMGFAFTLLKKDRPLYDELSYIVYFLNLILYSIYIKGFLCHLQGKRPG